MEKNKMILLATVVCLIVFAGTIYIGLRSGSSKSTAGADSVSYELKPGGTSNFSEAKLKFAEGTEFSELVVMAILNRELALSFDRLMGTGNKGFCNLDFHALGQVLRALQASLDASGVTQEELQVVLVRVPHCDEICEKKVCESRYFQDLNSRRENYGTPEEGH